MKAFWRERHLSPIEQELIQLVGDAHYKSTFRENPSSLAVQCAAQGSGELCKALAAALITLGGRHGPVEQTYTIIADEKWPAPDMVKSYLSRNDKVPGWGSSFTKGKTDQNWKPVDEFLLKNYEAIWTRMAEISFALEQTGHNLTPNPSAYTAAAAIALEMPRRLSPYLLVIGRIVAWSELFLNETKGN